jgi:hypothetical protein
MIGGHQLPDLAEHRDAGPGLIGIVGVSGAMATVSMPE